MEAGVETKLDRGRIVEDNAQKRVVNMHFKAVILNETEFAKLVHETIQRGLASIPVQDSAMGAEIFATAPRALAMKTPEELLEELELVVEGLWACTFLFSKA